MLARRPSNPEEWSEAEGKVQELAAEIKLTARPLPKSSSPDTAVPNRM